MPAAAVRPRMRDERFRRAVPALPAVLLLLAMVPIAVAVAPATAADEAGSGVRTLYLIRHGYYDYEDPRDPDVGKALVPLGMVQARLVAERLRSLPVVLTSLHSSTMTRARQTAQIVQEDFPGLELQQTRLLRECTPITWREDIMAEEDPADVAACEEQLEEAFATFFTPSPEGDRHDVLVCHGNVIRYLVTRVLKVETAAWLGMSIGNCSLTTVRIHPDGSMKLLGFGDVGHIPPNLQTGLYQGARLLVVPEE